MTFWEAILSVASGAVVAVLLRVLERVYLRRRPPQDVGRVLDRISVRAHALVDARLEVAWQERELAREMRGVEPVMDDQIMLVVELGQAITEYGKTRAEEMGFDPSQPRLRAPEPAQKWWPWKRVAEVATSLVETVAQTPQEAPRLPQVGTASMPPPAPPALKKTAGFVFRENGTFGPGRS